MNRQFGKVLVGAFVVGALLLIVTGILVFGSGSFFTKKNVFVLHFSGSVKGLNVGSPVVLRGVKIGVVRDIRISADSLNHSFSIPVFIEISKECIVMQENDEQTLPMEENLNALIKQGLRAQLEMQSLVTGQLLVALDFHPGKSPGFSGLQSEYLEIPTIQSDIEELSQKLRQAPIEEMFNKLLSVINSIDSFLDSESINELLTALTHALNSINTLASHMDNELPDLSVNLARTVNDANRLLNNADTEIISLSGALKLAVSDIRKLAAVTLEHVNHMGEGVEMAVTDARLLLAGIHKEVPPVSKGLQEVLDTAKGTLGTAGKASNQATIVLEGIGRLTDSDSAMLYNLNTTLAEIADAARALRMLAEYLERHPEALIQGK